MRFEQLRCLTFMQPFGSLVLIDHKNRKDIENRGWAPRPSSLVDGWFVVHAGARAYDLTDDMRSMIGQLLPSFDEQSAPRGAILGMAHVARVILPAETTSPWAFRTPRNRCWEIDRVIRLPEPVRGVPGAMGMWPIGGHPSNKASWEETARRISALDAAWAA